MRERASVALQGGSLVDRYLLQERLGSGSFGEVWKASLLVDGADLGIHRAIKLMKLTPAVDRRGYRNNARTLPRQNGVTMLT